MDLGDGYWKMFSIVIQLGAILCLPIYFWNRIVRFFQTFPGGSRGDKTILTHPISLTVNRVCLHGGYLACLLIKVIGKHLENLTADGFALLIGGIVMWVIDLIYGRPQERRSEAMAADELEHMTIAQSVWIGLCQTLAAGFSRDVPLDGHDCGRRSWRVCLVRRRWNFRFCCRFRRWSASTGYDLLKFLRPTHEAGGPPAGRPDIDPHGWALLAIGFVVSFVVAYGVIAWFMNWVRTRGFTPFAIYRILAGAAVLVWALSTK